MDNIYKTCIYHEDQSQVLYIVFKIRVCVHALIYTYTSMFKLNTHIHTHVHVYIHICTHYTYISLSSYTYAYTHYKCLFIVRKIHISDICYHANPQLKPTQRTGIFDV